MPSPYPTMVMQPQMIHPHVMHPQYMYPQYYMPPGVGPQGFKSPPEPNRSLSPSGSKFPSMGSSEDKNWRKSSDNTSSKVRFNINIPSMQSTTRGQSTDEVKTEPINDNVLVSEVGSVITVLDTAAEPDSTTETTTRIGRVIRKPVKFRDHMCE